MRRNDQFDRLLVALGAIHGGVEEGGDGIAGGHHAYVFESGGGGGEADADDQGDDGHDDHHLDEGDAAAGMHRSLTVAARTGLGDARRLCRPIRAATVRERLLIYFSS